MADGPDFITTWRVICTLAWNDEDFKNRLIDRPDEVLQQFNFPAPQGMSYDVVESPEAVLTLVLPAKPEAAPVAAAAGERAVSQYYASCL